jgi:hypothetical protein
MSDTSKTKLGIGLILAFLLLAAFIGVLLGGAVSSCFWGMMSGCELDFGERDRHGNRKKNGQAGGGTGTTTYSFNSNLREKDLRRKDLSNLDLSEANMRQADLRYANLLETDMSEADLRKADLRFANLTGANLSSARLNGADLRQANLSLANFEGNRTLRSASFSGSWAWSDELPTGLVGKAAVSICDEDLREDHESDDNPGKPKGC